MRRLLAIYLFLISALLGCDEQLPSYEQPNDVLEGFLQKTTHDTVTIVVDSREQFLGSEPSRFRVYVRNRYHQLLEGTSLVKGKIGFFAFVPTPKVGSSELTRNNVFAPPIFQGRIAVAPGDSAKLEVRWRHGVIGGRLYDSLQYTQHFEGTTRVRMYSPLSVTAEAEVQIFERVQAIRVKPITFTLVIQELQLNPK